MDIDRFIEDVRAHRNIPESEYEQLLLLAQDVLFQEGTLLDLSSPISVCGDVHGQFEDVLELFNVGGLPPDTRYLFLGDYVDRGYFSVDTLALMLAYKVKYPNSFYMLRGNHECRQVNNSYGFYEEILTKFGFASLWKLCNDVFDFLPIGAIIDNKIYCIHGGLSPKVKVMEQVAMFERRLEPQNGTEISDLLWSDPDEGKGWAINQRGAGFLFGIDPTDEFCHNNNINMIARAHQIAMDGYQFHQGGKKLVTVWSAPNYMYRSGNKASIMTVAEDGTTDFQTFDAVPPEQRLTPPDRVPNYFA